MPGLNAERFVGEAIESVLNQTFGNFELIFINDGSTDKTKEIVLSYQDPRIIYLDNERNLGLATSYNRGIDIAKGDYIARMDSDDICRPDRFEKQLSLLETRPDLDIVGSSISIINEEGRYMARHHRSVTQKGIKFSSLFSTPMYHPTVMGRAKIFKSYHFNENLVNSEDYELWSRLLFETDTSFANIDEPLLKYRVYPGSFTRTLNLDRRAVSAHNTISNLSHYLKLSETEKSVIVRRRQELLLSPYEVIVGLWLYFKASVKFCRVEKPSAKEIWGIWMKYLGFAASLFKHEARKIIRN